jgi:putative ABC transport system permease protein
MSIVNVRTSLQVLLLEITQLANFDVRVSLGNTLNKQGLEQRVLELPDVVDVEGWLTTPVRYLRPDQVQSDDFVLTGLPAESIFVAPQPLQGRWLEPYSNDNRYDIVITREVVEREPSIQVGRPIMLRRGDEEEMFRVVGVVEGQDQFAYGHYQTVSKFAGAPDEINSIILRTTDNSEETHNRVAAEVADYFDLRDFEIASSSTGNTFRRDLGAAFDIFAFTLLGVSLLIAIVAGLGLAGTMSLNVLERTREIGVLRSIGAATNTIRVMYVTEGFLVGLLSFVLAVPFVPLVTVVLNEFLGQISAQRSLPYATSAAGIAIWFGLVTIVSILSSVSPAQRASQISIREALSYE